MAQRFLVDKKSDLPVYVQLEERIRFLIHSGKLKAGDPLPTVRELAVELGINANTVARVYRDLSRDGLLRLERGIGTFVTDSAQQTMQHSEFKAFEAATLDVIAMAKSAGMTASEVAQFIQARWTED